MEGPDGIWVQFGAWEFGFLVQVAITCSFHDLINNEEELCYILRDFNRGIGGFSFLLTFFYPWHNIWTVVFIYHIHHISFIDPIFHLIVLF